MAIKSSRNKSEVSERVKKINIDGGEVFVYDNALGFSNNQILSTFLLNSFFKPVGIDGPDSNVKHHTSMMSTYSQDDVINSNFFDYLSEDVKEKHSVSIDSMFNCNINLVTPSDRFHIHTDSGGGSKVTLLYYPTENWNIEFGGDTLFLDESGENIEFYSQYKTDRLVIFDSNIPHLIRPSTYLAPYYRISLAMKFK